MSDQQEDNINSEFTPEVLIPEELITEELAPSPNHQDLIINPNNLSTHIILLIQTNSNSKTKRYFDFESVQDCVEGFCKIFENHLSRCNPNALTITYDITHLFDFMDQLYDLSCLVYQSANTYISHGKNWMKEKIEIILLQEALTTEQDFY